MQKAKSADLSGAAADAGRLLGRAVLGGLAGVGAVWVLTAFWPPSRHYLLQLHGPIQHLSSQYPTHTIGLVMGIFGVLLWQGVRK
jgi:hypothetical protein